MTRDQCNCVTSQNMFVTKILTLHEEVINRNLHSKSGKNYGSAKSASHAISHLSLSTHFKYSKNPRLRT